MAKVKARELFDKIVKQAHHNGEPGKKVVPRRGECLNPVPHLYPLDMTNPCVTSGETLIYTEQGLRRADELAAEGVEIKITTDARFGTDTFFQQRMFFKLEQRRSIGL
ncbi:MAG: hypothetical protein U0V48_01810 [Anaerolineales bacterium]